MTNGLAFARGVSTVSRVEKQSLFVQMGLYQQLGDLDEQPRIKHGCRRSLESKSGVSELRTILLEDGNTSKND